MIGCVEVQCVPKNRGISKCYSVCINDHLVWNLENSFLIHLKIEIHMFDPSTKPILRDIRELRNIISIMFIRRAIFQPKDSNS